MTRYPRDPFSSQLAVLHVAAPMYNPAYPPRMFLIGYQVLVNWTQSFFINAPVNAFRLYMDGQAQYIGQSTSYSVTIASTNQCRSTLILLVSLVICYINVIRR